MKTQQLNLFIVDDNPLVVTGLRNYLDRRFGNGLAISVFTDGQSALDKVDADTGIVILDYCLEGERGNEVLKSIKMINPKTEVIMLSANANIATAIDSFRNGASDYVIKGEKAGRKITSLVYDIITYPIRLLAREFGISQYIGMFALTFIVMGLGVCFALLFMY